jgi:hypothetical protein
MMLVVLFHHAIWLCWLGGIAAPSPVTASIAAAASSRKNAAAVVALKRPSSPADNEDQQPAERQQQQQHRDLVWKEDAKWCSSDKIFRLQETDPTIFQCSYLNVNWDANGILTARGELYLGKIPEGLNNPTTIWKAEYLKTDNTGDTELFCTGFGQCGVNRVPTNTGVAPGQYWYDCTNVYCGPQASRDCTGQYQDNSNTCPAGVLVANDPALIIPTLQSISCDYFKAYLATTAYADTCSECVVDNTGSSAITCQPRDVKGDGVILDEKFAFTELQRTDIECVSSPAADTSGASSPPRICLAKTSPLLYGAYVKVDQFACTATVEGAAFVGTPCQVCNICGFNDDARNGHLDRYASFDLLYNVDCTNLDTVSRYNACDGTITGLFLPLTSALVVKPGVMISPPVTTSSPPIPTTTTIPPPPPVAPMAMPVAVPPPPPAPTMPTTSDTAPMPAPVLAPVVPVPMVAGVPFGWPPPGAPFTWLTPVAAGVPVTGGGGSTTPLVSNGGGFGSVGGGNTPVAAPVAVVVPINFMSSSSSSSNAAAVPAAPVTTFPVVVPSAAPVVEVTPVTDANVAAPPVMPVAATATAAAEVVTAPTAPPVGGVVVPPSPVVGQTIQASAQSWSAAEMAYANSFSVGGTAVVILAMSLIVPTFWGC